MVNNFNKIRDLLTFDSEDIYYHLQILRRGKDHPDLPSANRLIKSYFICKLETLNKLEEEIINLCKFFNARAYINLSPKSIRKTTLLQLKYLSERIYINDYKKIWKSWNSCAGEIKGEIPMWIVDIDDPKEVNIIANFINKCDPIGAKIKTIIPTKSGFHLITAPFNLQQFKSTYPEIDVHKNNPTILYIP